MVLLLNLTITILCNATLTILSLGNMIESLIGLGSILVVLAGLMRGGRGFRGLRRLRGIFTRGCCRILTIRLSLS